MSKVENQKAQEEAEVKKSKKQKENTKKSNRGCWIVAGIGCGLMILVVGVIIALVFLVSSMGSSFSSDSTVENVVREGGNGKIAVIELQGIISHSDSQDVFAAVGPSPTSISDKLDKALEDEDVKGILINMNSPGGEVVASDLIYRKVMETSEEKPVVTWMSSLGASGGYLVAVGSDKIVAHPNCITGSIGTILEVSNLEELYDKVGIRTKTFKSGEYKDDEELFDDQEGEAEEIYQGLVDESYEDFVTAVSDGREMSKEKVRELADGRVYSGYQAYNNGLVDEVGDMDTAIKTLEDLVGEKDMKIIEYESPPGFFSGFSSYQHSIMRELGFEKEDQYSIGLYYLLEV
jgi:protease-4